MKHIICIFLSVFGMSVHAAKEADSLCQQRLSSLEAQGVKRGAFMQALKNLRTEDFPSRYILMAETGRPDYSKPEGSRVQGIMRMIDLKTGQVKVFKMWSGVPENAADVLNYKTPQKTFFGGQQIEVNENDFRTGHRMRTETISPSLKNKLAERANEPGRNQVLLKCSQKFRENPKRSADTLNDVCLEPRDLDQVFNALKAENEGVKTGRKPSVVMFTYPTRNLANYLAEVKLGNDEPNFCKALADMPVSAGGQDGGGGTAEPVEGVE